MDLETIRSRVQGYLGNRSDATQTLVDEAINEAYREMAPIFFFDACEMTDTSTATVASTTTVAIPSTMYHITHVKDITNDLVLEQKDITWYEENYNDDDPVESAPAYFINYGEQLILYPTPDDAYDLRIRGRKYPVALSANSDEPVYPEDWHRIIVLRAAADLAFYFGMSERGKELRNEELSKVSMRQEKRTLRNLDTQGQIVVERRGFRG
jgi:hypothetical protein